MPKAERSRQPPPGSRPRWGSQTTTRSGRIRLGRLRAVHGNRITCPRLNSPPSKPASVLANARGAPTRAAAAIAEAIRTVLEEAVEAGGSTLRDHRQANGELGYFQHAFKVYDREGLPCVLEGCGGMIARITQAGRSTFYCPKCQR